MLRSGKAESQIVIAQLILRLGTEYSSICFEDWRDNVLKRPSRPPNPSKFITVYHPTFSQSTVCQQYAGLKQQGRRAAQSKQSLSLRIWEVPCSNVGRNTACHDWEFRTFLHSLPVKGRTVTPNKPTPLSTTSLPKHSSLNVMHPQLFTRR
jgi:hypothetical protein